MVSLVTVGGGEMFRLHPTDRDNSSRNDNHLALNFNLSLRFRLRNLLMFKKFTLADFLFLGASFASIVFSKALYLFGHKEDAIFVGLWTPSILAFAIYLRVIAVSK